MLTPPTLFLGGGEAPKDVGRSICPSLDDFHLHPMEAVENRTLFTSTSSPHQGKGSILVR